MKRVSKNLVGMMILLILLILILAGVYVFGVRHFRTHFFPNSSINGVAVGDMTVDDAKYAIQNRIRDYSLTVTERNGITETITGDQIYMQYADNGEIQKCLDTQNPYFWIFRLTRGKSYNISVGYTYDKAVIDSVLDQMQCFQADNEEAPTSAMVVEGDDGMYTIQESRQGTTLDRQKTRLAVMQAIEATASTMDFEALDLYEKPSTDASDEELVDKVEDVNRMLSTNIVYDFVDRQYVVDKELVKTFLKEDENGKFKLRRDKVLEWVKNLSYETDTYGMARDFKTHSGRTIRLAGGGDYGWAMHQEETANELYHAIQNGEQGKKDCVYVYRAQDRSTNDIGGTYAEVCIEQQTMWLYKNGECIIETPVTTGTHSSGQDTPSGCVWAIDGKEANAIFPENGARVQYWLPFENSCGIHDSPWRRAYGGSVWLTAGSGGCVNTPPDAAWYFFDALDVGYPVVIYYSEDQPVGTQPRNATTIPVVG